MCQNISIKRSPQALKWALAIAILCCGQPAQATDVRLFLSPDGSHLCRQTEKGFSLWELATGKSSASWGSAPDEDTRPVFRADGKELLTLSANGTLQITQVTTGKHRLQLKVKGYQDFPLDTNRRAISLHPQGNWLALNTDGYHNIVLAARPGAQSRELSVIGDIEYPDLMAYSPNGKWLAFAGIHLAYTADDGESNSVLRPTYSIYLRKAPDGGMLNEVYHLEVDESLGDLVFSPDSKLLSISADSGLYLWDTSRLTMRYFLPESRGEIAFSSDSKRFATALQGEGFDGQIGVYDSQSGEQIQTLSQNPDTINSLAFSRDGKFLLVAESDTVKVFDLYKGPAHSYRFICKDTCQLKRSDISS